VKLLLSGLFALTAFAQTPTSTITVQGINMCSTCAIRQFIPGALQMPPFVQVFIYDTALSDAGYTVTLTYTTTDGAQHITSAYFPAGTVFNGNLVSLAFFNVDAVIASARVLAQAYTGAQAVAVAQ